MNLNKVYDRDSFFSFIKDFLPDFKKDVRKADNKSLKVTEDVTFLGESEDLDLSVFELSHSSSNEARVNLATDGFKLMKNHGVYTALVVYKAKQSQNWRLSLLTTSLSAKKTGGVKKSFSNPRRYSFFLGPDAKVNTPYQFLIKKGQVVDFEDLKSRFSIEVVNKEFYKQISQKFIQLVGGTLGTGKKQTIYKPLLKLPSLTNTGYNQIALEFGVRLIGRIIFCWFLREKKSKHDKSLMPQKLLSLVSIDKHSDYYHKVLEPIFFEVLNKQKESRKPDFSNEPFSDIPYLNGGLFSPHDDDFYKRTNGDLRSQFHNTLTIPDRWFKDLFEILETYNFTIDENTSFDEELSIDPEMLGRIFENLLAEINPETGESARKSTGSYYTPRVIVEYMVDESLLLYLKQQTKVKEEKLRAIISYDLTDDAENPLKKEDKEKITDALERVKLLDPACGSGAFPIGALQKMVFILQQIDPDGQLWFKRQIEKLPPELRRKMEKEHKYENYDYIRKLAIIRENIYGIDIQPIATEISRLRCFLTLVVDQYVKDDEENRNIEPLPNLDFKFVTANTLIPLPDLDKSNQTELFDNRDRIDELREIRDQYFNASGIEREQLKTEFAMQQTRLLKELQKEHGWTGVAKAELTQKLTDWEPFTHKMTPWFDPEWMFGIKEGFDVVIANPPYVDSEQMTRSKPGIRELYTQLFITAKGNWDLFVIFIERGINLLKKNGSVSFIIPNKLLSASYTKNLRKLLLTKSIKEIRDYSRVGVFVDQDIYPITLLFKNTNSDESDVCRMTTMKTLDQILRFNEIRANIFAQDIYWDRYFFNKNILELLIKIYRRKKLSDTIKTISSAATVSEAYEIKKYLFNDKNKIGYKLTNTGTIDRYISLWGEKKTQYIKDSYKFPKILSSDLQKINGTRNHQSSSPKIIIAGMSKKLEAFLDNKGEYLAGKSTSIVLGNSLVLTNLVGLLNSKLMTFFTTHFYHSLKMAGGYLNIEPKIIGNLPISPKMLESQIDEYVKDLISSKTEKDKVKIEGKIDQMVYKLYGLTKEEIKIVEENSK